MKWDSTKQFIEKTIDLIDFALPLYHEEGKSQLVIAVGCTGGKHRSVTIAQHLYEHIIAKQKYRVFVQHRDIRKP